VVKVFTIPLKVRGGTMVYLLFISFISAITPGEIRHPLLGTRVIFIIAQNDFRDEEYLIPRDRFEGLGAEITIASKDTTVAKGMLGLSVKPDKRLRDISLKDYDIVILVGGSGSVVFWSDEELHINLAEAADSGRIIGAICLAPGTLAKAGILKGKRATVYGTPGAKNLLKEEEAIYTGNHVERDDNIITADGPAAAKAFADEVVAAITEIKGREKEND
jgi:protease I